MQHSLTGNTSQAETLPKGTGASAPDSDARLRALQDAQLADQVCRKLRRGALTNEVRHLEQLRSFVAWLGALLLLVVLELIKDLGIQMAVRTLAFPVLFVVALFGYSLVMQIGQLAAARRELRDLSFERPASQPD